MKGKCLVAVSRVDPFEILSHGRRREAAGVTSWSPLECHIDPTRGVSWRLEGCSTRRTEAPVYLALTDGEGVVNLQLRLCGPDDDPLVAVNFQVTFQDRHQMLETDVRFGRVVFPTAGDYFLRLLAGKTVLAERRLVFLPLSGGES